MNLEKQSFFISEDFTVKEAMKRISDIGQKTLFIVNKEEKLLGSLSDGDIRKWILSEGNIRDGVMGVCNKNPKSVREYYQIDKVKQLMLDLLIECIPVVDNSNGIINILTWEDVFSGRIKRQNAPLKAHVVIMAGGKGTRLDPFTKILPKPLIPINDKPIIDIIMDKFGEYGVNEFFVSINHKAKMIKSYFEETNSKYKINYLEEEKPLGTAGSLRFLGCGIRGDILVTNCDTIIESDYHELLKFHSENGNDLTLVVSLRHYIIPFGVCEIENGGVLKAIKEKPEYDLLVNTGMCVLKSDILQLIPSDDYFDITDLMIKAKNNGYKVGVFPIDEKSWIDIGQWDEYRKALERIKI